MKKITFIIVCFFGFSATINAQNPNLMVKPIKVYLLGTFHFAQTDSSYNVFDIAHQKSIEKLCEKVSVLNPSKIFIERQPEYELDNKIDSLYKDYQQNNVIRGRNEIYQVGFRVAKSLGHNKLYQCDHPGQYGRFFSAAKEYAEKNNQLSILEGKAKGTVIRYDNTINEDSLMKKVNLLEYIRWINSDTVMNTSHAAYLSNYTQIGSNDYYNPYDDNTLIGADLTADWYKRNIMIYSKIINQLNFEEDAIFILIGSDHVPILKSLFSSNPYFKVIETKNWL